MNKQNACIYRWQSLFFIFSPFPLTIFLYFVNLTDWIGFFIIKINNGGISFLQRTYTKLGVFALN